MAVGRIAHRCLACVARSHPRSAPGFVADDLVIEEWAVPEAHERSLRAARGRYRGGGVSRRDIALRRGRHIDRDDTDWYSFLVDASEVLEPFYRRFGCDLVSQERRVLLPPSDRRTTRAASPFANRNARGQAWRCSGSIRARSNSVDDNEESGARAACRHHGSGVARSSDESGATPTRRTGRAGGRPDEGPGGPPSTRFARICRTRR